MKGAQHSRFFPRVHETKYSRYASRQGRPAKIRPARLPKEIAARCRRLSAAVELYVAGIDLRRTPDDEWFCFEVNPSPGFTYYQEATGQPIAEAVARFLRTGK